VYTPLFNQRWQLARGIRLRENCCLWYSLRLDENLDAFTGVLKHKVAFIRDIELTGLERTVSNALHTLLVAIRAIEEQKAVKILALLKALLCQCELPSLKRDITHFLKFFSRFLFLCDFIGLFDSVELEGQVELVVLVGSHFEGERFLAGLLQELG